MNVSHDEVLIDPSEQILRAAMSKAAFAADHKKQVGRLDRDGGCYLKKFIDDICEIVPAKLHEYGHCMLTGEKLLPERKGLQSFLEVVWWQDTAKKVHVRIVSQRREYDPSTLGYDLTPQECWGVVYPERASRLRKRLQERFRSIALRADSVKARNLSSSIELIAVGQDLLVGCICSSGSIDVVSMNDGSLSHRELNGDYLKVHRDMGNLLAAVRDALDQVKQCPLCGKMINNPLDAIDHFIHHCATLKDIPGFSCWCGEQFAARWQLARHLFAAWHDPEHEGLRLMEIASRSEGDLK